MALPIYSTGTVSVPSGGDTITGVGTVWSDVNVKPGDMILLTGAGGLSLISDVVDTTHLKVPFWFGTGLTNVAYKIYQCSPLRFDDVQIAQDLQKQVAALNTTGYIIPVDVGGSPDPSLGDDGQWATIPNTSAWWQKTGGVWIAKSSPVKGYGGTSTSSLTVGTGTKAFVTQVGLAYDGMRVRATSTANRQVWMEGVATYSGSALTLTVDAFNGSGTVNSWTFGIAGQPGNMTGSNNGSEFTNVETVRETIYAAPFDAMGSNNLITNGDSAISQRYGRTLTTLLSNSALYGIDCNPGTMVAAATWSLGVGQYDNASFACPPGFNYCQILYAITGLAALANGDRGYLSYYIEGYDAARLAWGTANAQPLTIGWWSKSSIPGQAALFVGNAARNRRYVVPFTRSGAPWQYHQATIPGCTDGTWDVSNGIGIEIGFNGGSGSALNSGSPNIWLASGYYGATGQTNFLSTTGYHFGITGVSAFPGNEGPNASRSPYIFRPFGMELDKCKRYYEKSYSYATAAGAVNNATGATVKNVGGNTLVNGTNYGSTSFNVQKRIAPTMRIFDFAGALGRVSDASPATLGANSGGASVVGENSFGVFNNSGVTKTTTNNLVLFQWDAEAGL